MSRRRGSAGPARRAGSVAEIADLGWCAAEVAAELPQLRLHQAQVCLPAGTDPLAGSPAEVRRRVRALSDSLTGARAVQLRREAVPAAYRVFFRHIGLDPDVRRTPIEDAVFERILHGDFASAGLLADVLLIALLDTGVRVWALDAAALDGPLGIRTSRDGEGRLVVADAARAVAVLFEEPADGHRVTRRTASVTLYALQVAGVPSAAVEEALWICRCALESAGSG